VKACLPQSADIYVIQAFPNSSFSIFTLAGEWETEIPKTLPKFIASSPSGWYQFPELPFSKKQLIGQTGLESELKKNYMLLKGFKYEESLVHIIAQIKPVGMTKQDYLLANEKKLIESLIRNTINYCLEQHASDKESVKQLAYSSKLLKQEVDGLSDKLNQQNKNYDTAITRFIQLMVNKLSSQFNIEIIQSPAFISALKDFKLPIEDLESTLSEHIKVEMNLALATGDSQIVLRDSHLKSLKPKRVTPTVKLGETVQLGRFTGTYNLLNRYETSAELVSQQGEKIIGKNIGKMCSPSVSNASITDALNKHARKIYELFQRYPNKWPIIRSEFKSVANIMEKEEDRRQHIA
jgi:hypothetical protein